VGWCSESAADAKVSFALEVLNATRQTSTTGRYMSMGNSYFLEKILLIMIGGIFLGVLVNIFLLIVTE